MVRQLVIIPGWGGTRQSWEKFIKLAEEDFDVHFIGLPCFDEPCPETPWGVSEYSDYVKDKIVGLRNPVLLGHSFGGQISVNLVANHPTLFSELILSGAAVLRPKYVLKRIFFGGIAKLGKIIFSLPILNRLKNSAKKVLYKAAGSTDCSEASGIKKEIFKKVIRASQEEFLGKIRIKTMVVWGDLDSYVPVSEGKKIAELIPEAELRIIPGGKHGLHIQQPEVLLEIIKKFVEK